eukprot:2127852-Prymnesium_polylepis.1
MGACPHSRPNWSHLLFGGMIMHMSPSWRLRSCSRVGSATSTPPIRHRTLWLVRQSGPNVAPLPRPTSALRKPVCASVDHSARPTIALVPSPATASALSVLTMRSLVRGATRSTCRASQPCASMYSRLSASARRVASD